MMIKLSCLMFLKAYIYSPGMLMHSSSSPYAIGIDSVKANSSLPWQVHLPRLADDMQEVASKCTVCHDYMLQLLLIEIVVHNLSEMFLFSNIFIKTYILMQSV